MWLKSLYTPDVEMLLSPIPKDEKETRPIIGVFLSSQHYLRKKKTDSMDLLNRGYVM